jgi:hypothetical protein
LLSERDRERKRKRVAARPTFCFASLAFGIGMPLASMALTTTWSFKAATHSASCCRKEVKEVKAGSEVKEVKAGSEGRKGRQVGSAGR